MKKKTAVVLVMFILAAFLLAAAQEKSLPGKYYALDNAELFLELKSDGTFQWNRFRNESGEILALSGTYRVDGKTLSIIQQFGQNLMTELLTIRGDVICSQFEAWAKETVIEKHKNKLSKEEKAKKDIQVISSGEANAANIRILLGIAREVMADEIEAAGYGEMYIGDYLDKLSAATIAVEAISKSSSMGLKVDLMDLMNLFSFALGKQSELSQAILAGSDSTKILKGIKEAIEEYLEKIK